MTFSPKTALALAEQLEQADRAATPGEWISVADKSGQCFGDGSPVCFIYQNAPDPHAIVAYQVCADDASSIATLRNLAASCARALREAVEECERYRSFEQRHNLKIEELEAPGMSWTHDDAIERLRKERDQARAECEAMNIQLQQTQADYGEVEHAHDALAAEVERMRRVCEIARRVVTRGIHRRQDHREVLLRNVELLPNDIEILTKLADVVEAAAAGEESGNE